MEKYATMFERYQAANEGKYGPFEDEDDWDLAKFLMENLGQKKTDQFLRLHKVKDGVRPSFKSNKSLKEKIDSLPQGPAWKHEFVTVQGDVEDEDGETMSEELELWYRDPAECVQELIGNPIFDGKMAYAPEKVFAELEGDERVFDEMWTADWWWKTQEKLPKGAMIAPLIIASDETKLSQFGGNKKAWPVYLTIGNIEKSVRRKPSNGATVLLGYLPSSQLKCFTKKERRVAGWQLFHHCMRRILDGIVEAGEQGVEMLCADGYRRKVFPVLAAYVADYPEQCLVTCAKKGWCPKCQRNAKKLGDLAGPLGTVLRDVEETKDVLRKEENKEATDEFDAQGLQPLYKPFWVDLPHADIFAAITPDILHQLHKGVFKDHLVKWCTQLAGDEIDKRYACEISHPGLCYFHSGISHITQSTGAEHKAMQKVFGCILPGAVQPGVVYAALALLDFIYYAQLRSHTTRTLAALRDALKRFHQHKGIFIDLAIRQHFNIPKIHSMEHYVAMIEALGSADGYNTESPERLHIEFAKNAYRATNRKEYVIQMTTWLCRQEALYTFSAYLLWTGGKLHPSEPEDPDQRRDVDGGSGLDVQQDVDFEDEDDDDLPVSKTANGILTSDSQLVAKKCPRQHVPVEDIISQHTAAQFIPTLNQYLKDHGVPTSADNNDSFDLYNGMSVTLPDLPAVDRPDQRRQRIRTTPAKTARPGRKAVPAHLDTVLVTIPDANDVTEDTGLE
ncbi:hypothetical protein EUX98_g9347, partial [Antrodiella citrinella]